jgi:hypothetical protein
VYRTVTGPTKQQPPADEACEQEFSPYRAEKGTVRFPLRKPFHRRCRTPAARPRRTQRTRRADHRDCQRTRWTVTGRSRRRSKTPAGPHALRLPERDRRRPGRHVCLEQDRGAAPSTRGSAALGEWRWGRCQLARDSFRDWNRWHGEECRATLGSDTDRMRIDLR